MVHYITYITIFALPYLDFKLFSFVVQEYQAEVRKRKVNHQKLRPQVELRPWTNT